MVGRGVGGVTLWRWLSKSKRKSRSRKGRAPHRHGTNGCSGAHSTGAWFVLRRHASLLLDASQMIALRRPPHELAEPKRFVALENPLMFETAHY